MMIVKESAVVGIGYLVLSFAEVARNHPLLVCVSCQCEQLWAASAKFVFLKYRMACKKIPNFQDQA